jgi:hypothetical protein
MDKHGQSYGKRNPVYLQLYKCDPGFFKSALDEEERPRIDMEDNQLSYYVRYCSRIIRENIWTSIAQFPWNTDKRPVYYYVS